MFETSLKIFLNFVLNRPLTEEVVDLNYLVLTIPIDTTHALLDTHRIPRQIVIDTDVTELEVNAFATSLRRYQKAHLRMIAKQSLTSPFGGCRNERAVASQRFPDHVFVDPIFLYTLQFHAAVNHHDRTFAILLFKLVNEIILSLAIFSKN